MDAKITNSNENKANPVNYSTQGFTGDPKLFLMRKFLLTFVLNLFAIIATASVQHNGLNYELNGSKNTATVLVFRAL